MALNLKPLGDRVIVEPIEKDEETCAGGALVLIRGSRAVDRYLQRMYTEAAVLKEKVSLVQVG